MPRRNKRIGPDGSIVKDGEEGNGAGAGGGGGSSLRRRFRLPREIDTFGFRLEPTLFAVLSLFVFLTMGTMGLALFASFFTLYTFYQRQSSSSSGGGGSRWKDGKALGANIKGVGDLPKAPKGG